MSKLMKSLKRRFSKCERRSSVVPYVKPTSNLKINLGERSYLNSTVMLVNGRNVELVMSSC